MREWVAEVTLTCAQRISVLPCHHFWAPCVSELEPLASFSRWDVSGSDLCYFHAWLKTVLWDHSVLSSHAEEALRANMAAPQDGRSVEDRLPGEDSALAFWGGTEPFWSPAIHILVFLITSSYHKWTIRYLPNLFNIGMIIQIFIMVPNTALETLLSGKILFLPFLILIPVI